MATGIADCLADILMTEHGIRREHSARQDQVFQHFQRHLMFVRVGGNSPLMEYALGVRIDNRQQMNGSVESMPRAAERLAVDGGRNEFCRGG